MCRMIDDLQVRCPQQQCCWIGALGDLEDHQAACDCRDAVAITGLSVDIDNAVMELKLRLETVEETLGKQREEIEMLKVFKQETESKVAEEEQEMRSLRKTVEKLEKESKSYQEIFDVFCTRISNDIGRLDHNWKTVEDKIFLLTERNVVKEKSPHDSCYDRLEYLQVGEPTSGKDVGTSSGSYAGPANIGDVIGNEVVANVNINKQRAENGVLKTKLTLSLTGINNYPDTEFEFGHPEAGNNLSPYEKEILTQLDNMRFGSPLVPYDKEEVDTTCSMNAQGTSMEGSENESSALIDEDRSNGNRGSNSEILERVKKIPKKK